MGAVPAAATDNVAVCPLVDVWLAVCVLIEAATGVAVTVSMADLLVTLPALLVTTTVNCPALPEIVADGVV